MSFDKTLKEKARHLTPSQRKLVEYVLSHEEESVFLNAGDLARRVGVSEATVVRLSKALGFEGFPEFQRELRQLFRNRLTTTSRLQKTVRTVSDEEDVLAKVLHGDIHNISETLKQVSRAEFKQFVRTIERAERIVIVGLRSAYSLAVFLGVALEFLQKNVWIVHPGIGDMWDRLLGLKKGDVVIGISFPRYTKQSVRVMQFARERGAKTLAITDSLLSPLAQHADHVLTAHYKMDSFIESFTAPLSLINGVVTALGVHDKKRTLRSLEQLEGIWRSQEIYYTSEK